MKFKFRYNVIDGNGDIEVRISPAFSGEGGFATAVIQFLAWLNTQNYETSQAKFYAEPHYLATPIQD